MKNYILAANGLSLILVLCLGRFMFSKNQHPVTKPSTPIVAVNKVILPGRNASIIKFIETHGDNIAPNYNEAVCTEFVIKVLEHFTPLTSKIKRDIRIITDEHLETLVRNDADVIKGVQTALRNAGIGTSIEAKDACAGDLVQFWNNSVWGAYGHCGFVVDVKVGEELIMYSSHPITGGFGKQSFPWPEKTYFVRLNE